MQLEVKPIIVQYQATANFVVTYYKVELLLCTSFREVFLHIFLIRLQHNDNKYYKEKKST